MCIEYWVLCISLSFSDLFLGSVKCLFHPKFISLIDPNGIFEGLLFLLRLGRGFETLSNVDHKVIPWINLKFSQRV